MRTLHSPKQEDIVGVTLVGWTHLNGTMTLGGTGRVTMIDDKIYDPGDTVQSFPDEILVDGYIYTLEEVRTPDHDDLYPVLTWGIYI